MTTQPVSLVTGASRGIGRAIAIALGQLGHTVAVNYLSRAADAEITAAAVERAGGRAVCLAGNVAQAADRQSLIERTVALAGRLDVLVNNAGITSPGRHDLLDLTETGWDEVLGTNLKGPFFLAQLASRQMIENIRAGVTTGGTIINISSISAYAISTDRADYCIAKAGMGAMTWLLADRLATAGIQVFEICPGIIATDMTAPVREKYDQRLAEGLAPMRRWGQPEDVARAVTALVSGALPYSTGDRINVDGGFHIRRL